MLGEEGMLGHGRASSAPSEVFESRNHCANGKEDSAEGSALPDTKFGGALHIPIELRSICFFSLYLHLPLLILSTFKYFTTYLRLA